MRKTTVYLADDEAEGLRRMAAATGRSQAELLREGVRRMLTKTNRRTFHSMGKGKGKGERRPRWDADSVYREALGRR